MSLDAEGLSASLGRLTREHGVPGAQLALRWRGEVITAEAGEWTSGSGRPVTTGAAFPLGSLTKPFTATLAMMLVDDGEVELDAPLAAHLPALGRGAAAGVTLRQALSHTGGLVATVEDMPPGTTRARWLERCAAALSAHPPGAVFSYSNTGYLLAGHLVEVVTGMSWRQAVESFLLRPLGIAPLFVVDAPRGAVVDGHAVRPHRPALPIAEQSVPALEEPVAALAASAADLLAFAELHLPGQGGADLLGAGTGELMRRDQLVGLAVGAAGLAHGWGLGWSLYRDTGRGDVGPEWFGHDGTGDGAWSHLRAEPGSGTVVAMTANGSTGAALWEALVDDLRARGLAVGNHPLSAPADPGPPTPAPAGCAGRYANGSWTCTVEAEGDDLFLALGSEPRTRLVCSPELGFTTDPGQGATPYTGRFLRDPATGGIDLLQVTGRLARRSAPR